MRPAAVPYIRYAYYGCNFIAHLENLRPDAINANNEMIEDNLCVMIWSKVINDIN